MAATDVRLQMSASIVIAMALSWLRGDAMRSVEMGKLWVRKDVMMATPTAMMDVPNIVRLKQGTFALVSCRFVVLFAVTES